MQDRIFLDTNILVYLANEDSPYHPKILSKFMEVLSKSELFISRQVLREYAVVMSRSDTIEKPLSSEEISSDIEKWQNLFNVADETEEVTKTLRDLIEEYQLKGKIIHGANIVATMVVNSVRILFTLNTADFKRFQEVEILNFEP